MNVLPTTGRLAYMAEPRKLAYAEYPLPEVEPDAILVEVLRANVCGSELHIWNGKHPLKKRGGLGHEMVCRIVSLGERRTSDSRGADLAIGDRVVCTYFQTCQGCEQCAGGQYNLCDNAYEFFGMQPEQAPHFHSAFATHYYIHPLQNVYKVDDSIGDNAAAGANCALSQVMFGVDQVDIAPRETVLIQGAGGLGLSAIAVARERGARVIVVDAVPARLEQARAFGADHIIDMTEISDIDDREARVKELTGGRGADVAIEVAGVPAAFAEGLRLIRRGGRYLVMGNLSPGATVPVDPGYVTRKALTVKHVDRYEARYLWRALEFLRLHGADYPFDTLVDAEFGFDEIETALDRSLNREVTRAVIRITEEEGAPACVR